MSLLKVNQIESLQGATGSIIITGNIIANGVPIAGATGATGNSGTSGTSGINGNIGPTGNSGTSGTSGTSGINGPVLSPEPQIISGFNFGSATADSSGWTDLPIATGGGTTRPITKVYNDTQLELFLNASFNMGIFSNPGSEQLMIRLILDGSPGTYFGTHVTNSGVGLAPAQQVVLKSVYTGLTAGTHLVGIQARTTSGQSSGIIVDPNSLGGSIIVTEGF